MATSGSWNIEWASTTWGGYPKGYRWAGNWSKSGNTITLSNMTLQIYMISGSGWGTGTDSVTVTGGGAQTVSWNMSGSASNVASLGNTSFGVGGTDTSATIQCVIAAEVTGSTTIYFDATVTPPTGLGADNIVRGIEEFTANVYISGWGQGSGTRYRELQCWTLGMTEPRRYQPSYGDSLSGNITVSNSSNGSLTIRGNTMYTLGVYASNGQANTGSISFGNYTTRAYAPTVSVEQLTDTTAVASYTLQSDGGQYAKNMQYSLDGGTTWVTGATVNTGSATTGSFTITGLTPDTSYTMKTRVSTNAGETNGADVTFRTYLPYEPHGDFYGSVNDVSRQINGFYGSIERQGTRVSKNINKLYGQVDGKAKLVHQSFGHLNYN